MLVCSGKQIIRDFYREGKGEDMRIYSGKKKGKEDLD